jgi:hypothetical protein
MEIPEGTLEQMWSAINEQEIKQLAELLQRLRNEQERPARPSYEIEADAYSQPWSGPL